MAIFFIIAISALLFAGGAKEGQAAEKMVTLKMGGIVPAEDLLSKAMVTISQKAKEKSGGSLNIQVFPAGQLGNATSQMEAVGLGSQDMFVDASAWMNQYVPDKLLINMFFMIPSETAYIKFLNSDLNKRFDEEFLKKTKIKIIANNFMRAPRQFASKKAFNTVAEFANTKIRVPDSKAFLESVAALGMKPTQIPLGETYLALTQGLVDATELSLDMLYSFKLHEATKNVIMTNHLYDSNVVMINDRLFQSLSSKQKEVLISVCKEVGEVYTKDVKNTLSGIVEKMKNENTNIVTSVDTATLKAMVEKACVKLENDGVWSKGLLAELSKIIQ
jgi:TRAP-type C4-dicarboxylate transport system substrate-binding protein